MGDEVFEVAVPFIFAAFTGDFFLKWCVEQGYHTGYSMGNELKLKKSLAPSRLVETIKKVIHAVSGCL